MSFVPVKAVSLDAYGTLFEGGSDDLIRLLGEVVQEARADVTLEQALGRREELIGELERRPFMDMRGRDTWILSTLFEEYGIDRDVDETVDVLHRTYYKVTPYPDARPCVDALREGGFRLAVMSNSDADMMARILEDNGFADDFDAVVTSQHAEAYKPAPAIFETVVAALDVPPRHVLHVGDSFTADVEGAKRAGMWAAWLRRPGGLPRPEAATVDADATVERLTDLPATLDKT